MINFLIVTVCVQPVLSNGEMIFTECALIQGHVASHHCWLFPTLFLSPSCGEPSGRPDHKHVVLGGRLGRQLNLCPFPIDASLPLESQASGDHKAPSQLQVRKEWMLSELTQKLGQSWGQHARLLAFSPVLWKAALCFLPSPQPPPSKPTLCLRFVSSPQREK